MTAKTFISAQQLLEDSYRLGMKVLDSGFRPGFIVGIWRGGTPVGIAVQELLSYFGVETDHISIRTSYYSGIEQREKSIRVHGLKYLIDHVNAGSGLLLVDDVFDTGRSVQAVIRHIRERARRNTPEDLRIAVPYYKPGNNRTDLVPDYYLHETDRWLVFPHELKGLTPEEIRSGKLGIDAFKDRL